MNALQVPTTAVWTTATSTNTKYRSIALVVLDIQICRHKIRHTSGLPEILDTGLTGATASFAHLPQPLFHFSPVTRLRVNKNRLSENAFTMIFKNEHYMESNYMRCTVRGLPLKKTTRPSITVYTSKLNDFV